MLLQDWSGSSPNLVLAAEPIEVVDKCIYLGSCISAGGLARNEISLRVGNASAAFCQLRHLTFPSHAFKPHVLRMSPDRLPLRALVLDGSGFEVVSR